MINDIFYGYKMCCALKIVTWKASHSKHGSSVRNQYKPITLTSQQAQQALAPVGIPVEKT